MTGEWNKANKILCVRLDTMGDVLMTEPAIRALKHAVPGRQITVLTSPSGAHAARYLSAVDSVITYEAPWMKATRAHGDSRSDMAMVDRLRDMHFDAAVIFTVFSQNPLPAAFLCYLSDIPLRLAHCRENPYYLLTHWVRESDSPPTIRHEVQRQLDLACTVGAVVEDDRLSLSLPRGSKEDALVLLAELGIDTARPWILIHPGATALSRRYPPAHFAQVAERLMRGGYQVVFTGSADEQSLIASIQEAAGVPSRSLAGRLDFAGLAGLIAVSPLLISNNTGPVHIAAAVGTPVVDLYALTNPQHTPWHVASRVLFHEVPCKYCYKSLCPEGHHACLAGVQPATVVQAALELLKG